MAHNPLFSKAFRVRIYALFANLDISVLQYPAYLTLPYPLADEASASDPISAEDLKRRLRDGTIHSPVELSSDDLRLYQRLAAIHRIRQERNQNGRTNRGAGQRLPSLKTHAVSLTTLVGKTTTPDSVRMSLEKLLKVKVSRTEKDGIKELPLLRCEPVRGAGGVLTGIQFELTSLIAAGRTRPFVPRVRGDLAAALASPQAFVAIGPEYPAPISLLVDPQLANASGVTAQDIALFHLLLAHAQRVEPGDGKQRPLQAESYEIPLDAARAFLGSRPNDKSSGAPLKLAGRRDVERSLQRLSAVPIWPSTTRRPKEEIWPEDQIRQLRDQAAFEKAVRSGRRRKPAKPVTLKNLRPHEPAISSKIEPKGPDLIIRYEIASGISEHFKALGRHAYIELAGLVRMRSSYSCFLYLMLQATTYRHNYRGPHNVKRLFKPTSVATALGYPLDAGGKLKGGFAAFERRALNDDILAEIRDCVRRFDEISLNRQQAPHARGKPILLIEIEVRIARPALHSLKIPEISTEEAQSLTIKDEKRFKVSASTVARTRRLLAGLPQPEDWQVRIPSTNSSVVPPHRTLVDRDHTPTDDSERVRRWKKGDPHPRRIVGTEAMQLMDLTCKAWTLAVHEALGRGGPYGPGYWSQPLRGERLLKAVGNRGPDQVFYEFISCGSLSELRRWITNNWDAFAAIDDAACQRMDAEAKRVEPHLAESETIARGSSKAKKLRFIATGAEADDQEPTLSSERVIAAPAPAHRSASAFPLPSTPDREIVLHKIKPICEAVDRGERLSDRFHRHVEELVNQAAVEQWPDSMVIEGLFQMYAVDGFVTDLDDATEGILLKQFRTVSMPSRLRLERDIMIDIARTFATCMRDPPALVDLLYPRRIEGQS